MRRWLATPMQTTRGWTLLSFGTNVVWIVLAATHTSVWWPW